MRRALSTTPERRSAAEASHPFAMLFVGGGVTAVVVAIAQVWSLAIAADVGRIRELELLLSARLLFENGANLNLAGIFPVNFNRPFELKAFVPFVTFLALSIAVTLVVFWIAAVMMAPLLMAARRAIRGNSEHRLGSWVWERAYPLAIVVGFALPATMIPLRANLVASRLTILATALAISFVAWLTLLVLLRRPQRFRRAVHVSTWAAGAFTAVVWAAAVVAGAFESRPAQPPAAGGTPNVLLVSIDSLRHDHLHCYGYPRETSPTIDALAREGVLFQTVVSPTSWTLPAHLTLLTALPPEEHGVTPGGARMGEDADLVHTISRWLDAWSREGRRRPFFMLVHMWDVHYDYTPPPPYDSMFDPDYQGTMTGENFQDPKVFAGMNPRDLEHIIALYDGEIRFTHLHLGDLIDQLGRLGILDNTIAVVTADHGDEFFEHGRKGHKQALYDETILVPLVIRYPPKVPQGARVEAQVRLMDIPMTILALAGVGRPPAFGASLATAAHASRDLIPWVSSNPTGTLPPLVAFSDLIGDAPVPVASIRTQTSKLIQEQKGAAKEELYDLAADPGERANVSVQQAEVGAQLRGELSTWRNGFAAGRTLSRKAQLSEAHKERLRELGYGE